MQKPKYRLLSRSPLQNNFLQLWDEKWSFLLHVIRLEPLHASYKSEVVLFVEILLIFTVCCRLFTKFAETCCSKMFVKVCGLKSYLKKPVFHLCRTSWLINLGFWTLLHSITEKHYYNYLTQFSSNKNCPATCEQFRDLLVVVFLSDETMTAGKIW